MGKHNQAQPGMKRCSNKECRLEKLATTEFFYRNKSTPDGLWWYCKNCCEKANKERYDSDREGIIAKVKVSNKTSLLVNVNRRRVQPGAACTLTRSEWIECLEFFGGLDAYTGRPMIHLAMDHVIPLSKGGGHEKHNVVPCDGPINLWKHDDDIEEWYRTEIAFFDEDRLAKIKAWTNQEAVT